MTDIQDLIERLHEWIYSDANIEPTSETTKLIAASLNALESLQWRPVAEAPKDGTHILLYNLNYGTRRRSAIQTGHWHQPSQPYANGFWTPTRNPTHYLPLDALPPVPGE